MYKIVLAKENDIPSLMKCFRRVDEFLVNQGLTMWDGEYPNEALFREDMEKGSLFIAKEGARVIGSVSVSHDIEEAFFEESRSAKKSGKILEAINYHEEMLTVLHRLFVDPAYHHQGIARALVRAIEAKYNGSTFLLAVYTPNEGARKFYSAIGYIDYGVGWDFEFGDYSDEHLFVKRDKNEGLCRGFAW